MEQNVIELLKDHVLFHCEGGSIVPRVDVPDMTRQANLKPEPQISPAQPQPLREPRPQKGWSHPPVTRYLDRVHQIVVRQRHACPCAILLDFANSSAGLLSYKMLLSYPFSVCNGSRPREPRDTSKPKIKEPVPLPRWSTTAAKWVISLASSLTRSIPH
jgi:hypothetical protein